MQSAKLDVTMRTDRGKGAARQARMRGLVPAVCYGGGFDTLHLYVDPNAMIRSLDADRKRNTVFALHAEGEGAPSDTVYAMVRDYQQDTLKGNLLHVDFIRVFEDHPIEVRVPLHFTGKIKGVQEGGTAHQVYREVMVACSPANIPAFIEHDATLLDIGDMVQVKDVDSGEGVTIMLPPEQTLFTVIVTRVELPEEEEETTEEAEQPEGTEAPKAAE